MLPFEIKNDFAIFDISILKVFVLSLLLVGDLLILVIGVLFEMNSKSKINPT